MSPIKSSLVAAYLAVAIAAATTTAAVADNAPTAVEKSLAGKATPAAAPAKSKSWWAYEPVQPQSVPSVKQKGWVRTPIDAFVLAKLEENGLAPSHEVDRAAFIRRATLDAWGLVPTPEEVSAFVKDRSPQAFEHLVDRLLASPRYGERQGRRWLDLARYADSVGFTNDEDRPTAWRYRDYVIDAFNQDKPYDRFIREQVAGDELWPDSQQALIATFFLRNYPDDSNSRDLVEKKYQNTTDMTDTVGAVFLGSSVGCARCHDHKFDRVSEKEYFQLQSFFANTNARDDIPAERGEQENHYLDAVAKWKQATADIRAKQKAILDEVRPDAIKYEKERFFEDTRASLFKPESQWNATDRWINNRYAIFAKDSALAGFLEDSPNKALQDKYAEYKKLDKELKKFDKLKPRGGTEYLSAVTELGHADAPPTYLLHTGDLHQPTEEVQPVIPAWFNPAGVEVKIKPLPASSGRRTALAEFLTDPRNGGTARVYVNRIWAQYFGNGIVETVSDFGKAGKRPTHPELLDYLADQFVKNGWSSKQLHRQILLSSTYRQASDFRADAAAKDPENKWLAVFPRQRLEAEQIRDSLLAASGQLNEKIGGPAVFPPIPKSALTDNRVGAYDWVASDEPADYNRRSVYVFVKRSQPYPLLNTFDGAAADVVHSKREVTTTPLQSLALINSDLVHQWAQDLAGRVINETKGGESQRLERLYQILYSRTPDTFEKQALVAFLDQQDELVRQKVASGTFSAIMPVGLKSVGKQDDPVRLASFVALTHSLLGTNEFLYRY
jgi:hypothetical protein